MTADDDVLKQYFSPEARKEREAKIAAIKKARQAEQDAAGAEFLAKLVRVAQTCVDPKADDAVREAEEAKANAPKARADRRRMRLVRAGVNDTDAIDLLASSADTPSVKTHEGNMAAFEAVDTFLRPGGDVRTLWLLGKRGTGKSYAGMWAVAQFEGEAILVTQSQMRMGSRWDDHFERARNSSLVLIDDPDEHMFDWQANDIATLLSDRHNQRRKTIVTANLTPYVSQAEKPRASVEGLLGPRVMSRMEDKRFSRTVIVKGDSLRRRA